ncbi:FRG domain-containing protein [Agriterribacter sp.]|uniref:FRG domain-containing protein n=1 Tax=Agriterribacter sp. TaxID=2821509 RepID=UPI002C93A206|nr:FRG domain-containing protein [Agriterribacter sp.]HRO46617.1 FRG domain-containing protein [Agriterribacter sp.]HRQ17277.1 FRG domain-containing protein [Agriterribacter sp.]
MAQKGIDLNDYIFRGEGSLKYKLIPSGCRENNRKVLEDISGYRIVNPNYKIDRHVTYTRELRVLREFYINSDIQGLKIPDIAIWRDGIVSRHSDPVHWEIEYNDKPWMIPELYEVAALAQHYGLPTRLLDWSYNIYTALFFAAIGALNNYSEKDHFTVYFLNHTCVSAGQGYLDKNLELIRPIYSGNENLRAQEGLFSVRKLVSPEDDQIPLDEYLQNNSKSFPAGNLILKLLIPHTDCYLTLNALDNLGINEMKLFPGFEGIVEHQKRVSKDYSVNERMRIKA